MTIIDSDSAKRWWKVTGERLRQPGVCRVEISIAIENVRTQCVRISGGYDAWWVEDFRGDRAYDNNHEAIHEARKAVVALAQEIGCWKLVEDNAYSLVFERQPVEIGAGGELRQTTPGLPGTELTASELRATINNMPIGGGLET